jgi:hypothetical protein
MKVIHVLGTHVQQYATPFVREFRLSTEYWSGLLFDGNEVYPEPIQMRGGMLWFLLSKCEAKCFAELDRLSEILNAASHPWDALRRVIPPSGPFRPG